jgi:glycosyltransferase involved in cell wall biosynthesis
MKILVLCLTPRELIVVDRRVLNQCHILANDGWDVELTVPTSGESLVESFNGITLRSFHFKYDTMEIEASRAYVSEVLDIPSDYRELCKILPIPTSLTLTEDHFEELKLVNRDHPLDRYLLTVSFINIIKEINPDVVYCADYHGIISAYVAHKELQIPYVIDSHEYCLSHSVGSTDASKLIRYIESKCFLYARQLLTVSYDFSSLYRLEYGKDCNPLVYHNTPVPAPVMEDIDIRKTLNLLQQDKIVIFHGGLSLYKRNLENLLKSAKYLKEHRTHILFMGYGALAQTIQGSNYSNVHYLPPVSQDILQNVVRQVNFVIIPYIAQDINQLLCAPNRLFDALSSKIPILGNSKIISVSSIIDKFGIGLTGPMTTPKEIADLIGQALSCENQMREAYEDNASNIEYLYGYDMQKDVIKYVSSQLKLIVKERTVNPISQFTRDLYMEHICSLLVSDETDKAYNLINDLINKYPNIHEAKSLLNLNT